MLISLFSLDNLSGSTDPQIIQIVFKIIIEELESTLFKFQLERDGYYLLQKYSGNGKTCDFDATSNCIFEFPHQILFIETQLS